MGFGGGSRESARAAHGEMRDGILVLTEGKSGALAYTANEVVETAGYPVTDVADTVGAGDTFHSALLAFLYREGISGGVSATSTQTLTDARDFACAAASINVTRAGCSPPTQEETEAFIGSSSH